MRLVLAEDDAQLAAFVSRILQEAGHQVTVATDGERAIEMASASDCELLVLDLGLPRVDGLEVIQRVRSAARPDLLILVLSARSRPEDRVQALDQGADDYLSKPFSSVELLARIRAVSRRGKSSLPIILHIADLELNRVNRTVMRAGRRIELTTKEFGLLEYLMRNADHRVTRNMIVEHVWNLGFDTGTNIVDVYVNYLRRKIDDGASVKLIRTVRGVGYELTCRVEANSVPAHP